MRLIKGCGVQATSGLAMVISIHMFMHRKFFLGLRFSIDERYISMFDNYFALLSASKLGVICGVFLLAMIEFI